MYRKEVMGWGEVKGEGNPPPPMTQQNTAARHLPITSPIWSR